MRAGLLILATTFVFSSAHKILTVGDSWAAYSGNTFTDYCAGATQINKGIGGTTADQWIAGKRLSWADSIPSFQEALQAAGWTCSRRSFQYEEIWVELEKLDD